LVDCCEVNEKVGAAQLFRRIVSVIVIRFSLKLRIESRVFPQGRGELRDKLRMVTYVRISVGSTVRSEF
jgi:hypothetical protein